MYLLRGQIGSFGVSWEKFGRSERPLTLGSMAYLSGKDCSPVLRGTPYSKTSSLLLLTFALMMLFTLPHSTQGEMITVIHVSQATTVTTASNATSTSSASVASSSGQWDVLILVLILGVGASLAMIIAAVIAVRRRHARFVPMAQLICPRCRAPIGPYDVACRKCRTPIYHPYRYYQQRR
jgi:hypothetical protein